MALEDPGFTCLAPLHILDELLHDEGFADVRYVDGTSPTEEEDFARGEYDFGQDFASNATFFIDAGVPAVSRSIMKC